MATGRERFGNFLQGQPTGRPPIIPLLSRLVARVGGVASEVMELDASLWSGSLTKTIKLFAADAVVAGFDATLMAEACGCEVNRAQGQAGGVAGAAAKVREAPGDTGRLTTAIDVAQRIFDVNRNELGCIAALTGPATLAAQVFGPGVDANRAAELKPSLVQTVEAYCKTRPDLLLLVEDASLGLDANPGGYRRLYNTVKNMAGYYGIPVGLYVDGYDPDRLAELGAFRADLYVVGPGKGGGPPLAQLRELALEGYGVGLSVPLDNPDGAASLLAEWANLCAGDGRRSYLVACTEPENIEFELNLAHRTLAEIKGLTLSL